MLFATSEFYICALLPAIGFSLFFYFIYRRRIKALRTEFEGKVKEKTDELVKQSDEINQQKQKLERQTDKLERKQMTLEFALEKVDNNRKKLEDKNKEITDSIKYASRIQESIFPVGDFIKEIIPNSFILFKPKDILSGDFYWVEQYPTTFYSELLDISKPDYFIACAVDCTGHGVPGALMSILGSNLLNNAINERNKIKPNEILLELNTGMKNTLGKTFDNENIKDGMDVSMIMYDIAQKKLSFAGAKNPMYHVRNNKLTIYKGDRVSIGQHENIGEGFVFTDHVIDIQEGDVVYLFSDGYADQFGGKLGKKFKYNKFKKLLTEISSKPMNEQYEILDKTMIEWMGTAHEQVDDILVIGVKFESLF